MKDKAVCFSSEGRRVIIIGKKGTMEVSKRDAYRLMMVCKLVDPAWDILPADWRKFYTMKKP